MNTAANSLCCPVCTLYMREGITLQSHLNTHPKDQVIEALVRCTTENPVAVKQQESVTTDGILQDNQAKEFSNTAPQFSSAGGSHFTAAITYQQFLSSISTSGSDLAAQYVSVPTVVTPDATSSGPTNQALMPFVYNPYIIPQQQQLNFLNAVNQHSVQQPMLRQIPVMNQGIYPLPPPPTHSPLSSISHYEHHTVQRIPNDQVTQTNRIPLTQIDFSSESVSDKEQDIETTHVTQNSYIDKNPKSNGENVVVFAHAVSNDCLTSNQHLASASHSTEKNANKILSKIVVESNSSNDGEGGYKKQGDQLGDMSFVKQLTELKSVEKVSRSRSKSPDLEVVKSFNNKLHVNDERDCKTENICHSLVTVENVSSNSDRKEVQEKAVLPLGNLTSGDINEVSLKQINVVENVGLSNYDLISKKVVLGLACSNNDETINLHLLGTVAASNVNCTVIPAAGHSGNIEVHKISDHLDNKVVEPECKDLKQESGSHDSLDLNIRADEMMPPRGELSEQESLGGNDSTVWVQNYQDVDDVSASYDLLARESWDASDGSDAELCGQLQISPVAKTKTTDGISKKGKMTKIYKCSSCSETFNCPKERRVHSRTFHSGTAEGTKSHQCKVEGTCASMKTEAENDMMEIEKMLVPIESSEESFTDTKMNDTNSSNFISVKSRKDEVNVPNVSAAAAAAEVKANEIYVKTENFGFKCVAVRCSLSFTSEECLKDHMDTVHRERCRRGSHICGTCHEIFPSEILYRAHLKEHPLECNHCGKFFSRHQNLNLHVKRHLGIKPFKCDICDKAFVTKQKLTEHTNVHTGDTPIKCGLCQETFRRYSNLIQHKNRHHLKLKKKVKDFFCHCGEVFHSKKRLEWHKEIHDEKPKSCPFCSVRFVHSVSLTRHIRRSHDARYVPQQGREVENVHCPICNNVFLRGSMAAHMRLHTGERPFQCNICIRRFTTKWNLQIHRWTHTARSAKPYKCALCKAAFYRHSVYTAHVRSHRGAKPYICNYCGRPFVYKYNCVRHVREHEVSKRYACAVCGKKFHRGYYLKEHMTVHSGSRPYTCHICGKGSSTKSNHNKHVRIHHAREPVNTEG